VLLVLLVRAGVDVWTSRRVSAQWAALESRYGSLDERTLRTPPVPEGDNRAALRVADDARSRRSSNWEADYATGSNTLQLLEIRRLSSALYLEARVALDAGHPDEAARALATGLSLSASLRQEPALIAQLIRCAVALQHFEGVQRLLTESDPSDAAMEVLAGALAENQTPAPMHAGLLGELKIVGAALGRAADGGAAGFWGEDPVPWIMRPMIRVAHA